jgi:hypothetical protein
VYAAFGAGWFTVSQTAFFQFKVGIFQKHEAPGAKAGYLGMIIPAKKLDHGFYSDFFIFYFLAFQINIQIITFLDWKSSEIIVPFFYVFKLQQ